MPAATSIDSPRAPRRAEWVSAVAGATLCASLFLDWYEGRSAWSAFVLVDLVLLLTAAAAVGMPLLRALRAGSAVEVAAGSLTALLGLSATVLVVFRTVVPPLAEARAAGLFVGLVAAAGVLAGAIMSVGDERE